jgi:hypothetical protein
MDSIKNDDPQKTKRKKKKKNISQRVASEAGKIVSQQGYVSVIDLFLKIGWLAPDKLLDWKRGRVPYLERVITANLGKISRAMKEFRSWAIHSKLKASVTIYKHGNHPLHFSKTGQSVIETAYSTHYVLIKSQTKEGV